jgi:hypothetical protein
MIDFSADVAGYYGSKNVCAGNMWTMEDAVQRHVPAGAVTAVKGVPSTASADTSGIAAAAAAAAAADVVVMAIGADLDWAREGRDATSISLSNATLALVEAVAKAARKPITVVQLTSTPLDISALLANPKVGAILHTGVPSVTVLAVGDLLFGKASPAGRLVQSILPASYAAGVSIFDMGMRPGPSDFPAPSCTTQPQSACANATNPGRT